MKKLLGGGYEKIYDIGPRFRNEHMTEEHLPEHLAMEWYWAYASWEEGMSLMEEMFAFISQQTFGHTKFSYPQGEVDFSQRPWPRKEYRDIMMEHYDIDVLEVDLKKVKELLKQHKLEVADISLNSGIDKLFKNIRHQMKGPCWVIRPPLFMFPLAKQDSDNPQLAQRFWGIIGGSELCNGFGELNNPQDQLERMEAQQALREAGDKEAQMLDIDFIEMLEYGMPPACGLGFSERVFWSLEGGDCQRRCPF